MSILTPPNNIPVPIIYVSHLPSASSFYASLTQPIGIQFLSHANVSPECLNYGYISQSASGPRSKVVFSVTQSATPSLSHLTLSAPSEQAVREFHAKSWVLNQGAKRGENILEKSAEEERALTRDFDGNMIETVYSPRSRGGQRGGAPVIELETASTQKEARRVLEWQEEVARSIVDTERSQASRGEPGPGGRLGGAPGIKRADSYPLPIRETPRLVRRETVTTTEHYREPAIAEKKETSSTGNAIIGSLIGVAAVAGLAAYAFGRSASPEPIPVARRGSAGERGGATTHYHGGPIEIVDRERVVERTAIPARSYVSERGHEGERERVQPSYVNYTVSSTHSQAQSSNRERELARIDERSYHSSRAPSKVDSGGRYERERERERDHQRPRTIVQDRSPERVHVPLSAPVRELIIEERETSPSRESHVSKRSHKSHRSHKSSTSRSPRNHEDRERGRGEREEKRYVEDRDERESSYTSARSHHTTSTVKPPPVPVPPPAASLVSTSTARASESGGRQRRRKSSHAHSHSNPTHEQHASSPTQHTHYSTSPTHYSSSPRHVPLPESVFSDRTARQVPLPESVAGHSEWERGSVRMVAGLGREYNEYRAEAADGYGSGGGGGGYAASVAPSDSISSVGIKRERDRLRDRMRMRDGHGERGTVGGGW